MSEINCVDCEVLEQNRVQATYGTIVKDDDGTYVRIPVFTIKFLGQDPADTLDYFKVEYKDKASVQIVDSRFNVPSVLPEMFA